MFEFGDHILNTFELSPTAAAVYRSLEREYQRAFLSHNYPDDPDELLAELALAQVERVPALTARCRVRRFTDGGNSVRSKACVSIEAFRRENDDEGDNDSWQPLELSEEQRREMYEQRYARELNQVGLDCVKLDIASIANRHRVSMRRAYQIIEKQIERARANSDLFAAAAA